MAHAVKRLSMRSASRLSRRSANHSAEGGFTLVETLVALLVVALAYGGVSSAISRFVDQRHLIAERQLGHRIAWNRLMEQYLISRQIFPAEADFGAGKGAVTRRGQDWAWRISEQDAAGDGLLRYEVEVFADKGEARVIASLAAFFSR